MRLQVVRARRLEGRSIVCLTGAGVSTGSGIPDYVSGTWLDPEIPVGAYAWERFLDSPRCRRLYWDACSRFRRVAEQARPNGGHAALRRMEERGWLAAVVTQNVDRLHKAAGSTRVHELHGRIDRVEIVALRVFAQPAATSSVA